MDNLQPELEVQDEKGLHLVEERNTHNDVVFIPDGVVTFSDLFTIQESKEQVRKVETLSDQFRALVENIFLSEEVQDKAGAVSALATEFSGLVANPPDDLKEIDHYKEVSQDPGLAVLEDFQGGCSVCGFGDLELKGLCPYCGNGEADESK